MYPLKSTTILNKNKWRLQTIILNAVFFFHGYTRFDLVLTSCPIFIYNGNGDAVETFLQ